MSIGGMIPPASVSISRIIFSSCPETLNDCERGRTFNGERPRLHAPSKQSMILPRPRACSRLGGKMINSSSGCPVSESCNLSAGADGEGGADARFEDDAFEEGAVVGRWS